MDRDEIQWALGDAIKAWQRLEARKGFAPEITGGARDTLAILIEKIQTDPSPVWVGNNYDEVQRFAISVIPKILGDLTRTYRRTRREIETVSSWELFHRMTPILNSWCAIPKSK